MTCKVAVVRFSFDVNMVRTFLGLIMKGLQDYFSWASSCQHVNMYMILVCWSLPRSGLFCIKDNDKDKDKDKDNGQHIAKDMRVQEPGVVPCQGQVCFAPAKSPGRSW